MWPCAVWTEDTEACVAPETVSEAARKENAEASTANMEDATTHMHPLEPSATGREK